MEFLKDIRAEKLLARKNLSEREVAEKSELICCNLQKSKLVQNAKTVLTYLPYGNEASLKLLNEFFWQKGVRLLVPVCRESESGIMDAALFMPEDLNNLKKTKLGVWEPKNCITEDPENIDLVLVPGVVFDRQGGRMGHGMGYYDRYLPKLKKDAKAIGIGYEIQLLDFLPRQPWDYPLDGLCTEEGFYEF